MDVGTHRLLDAERLVSYPPDFQRADVEGGFLAEALVPAVRNARLRRRTLAERVRVHPDTTEVKLSTHQLAISNRDSR